MDRDVRDRSEPRAVETEAVLAREFVHLRGRHREILTGAAILALPLIYRFSHLTAIEGALPWAVRGPLLVWLTPVILYLLWRRFERTTDAQAGTISGQPEAVLQASPMKMAQFNMLSMYWRKIEARFFPNGETIAPKPAAAVPDPGPQTGPAGPSKPKRLVSADS